MGTDYFEYDINSGDIIRKLSENWKRYDRDFLEGLEVPIRGNLIKNNIITVPYNKEQDEYFRNYRDELYPHEQKQAQNEYNFPIPDYFLRKNKQEDPYPSIVEYSENCLVHKDDTNFDAFFALKLSLTDEMEIKKFLNYQLATNFKTENIEYIEFLGLLLVKYKEFLANGKTDLITNKYIAEMSKIMQDENTKATADNDYSIHNIDTGRIFDDLLQVWENYDRKFIRSLEYPIRDILRSRKIISRNYIKGINENLMVNYRDIIYPGSLKECSDEKEFPFPNYFLDGGEYPNIIYYSERCLVQKDDDDFDLFFALKLSLTDLMKLDNFLKYQLEKSFELDKNEYNQFLKLLLIKHKEILVNGKIDLIIGSYITDKTIDRQKEENKKIQEGKNSNISIIKWTNNTNKNDFVKIIYALYEAKLINNGEGEITKIVEQAATAFGVELGKNWQSNFSKNKNDQNADYDHAAVFDKLKKAYQEYLKKNKKI